MVTTRFAPSTDASSSRRSSLRGQAPQSSLNKTGQLHRVPRLPTVPDGNDRVPSAKHLAAAVTCSVSDGNLDGCCQPTPVASGRPPRSHGRPKRPYLSSTSSDDEYLPTPAQLAGMQLQRRKRSGTLAEHSPQRQTRKRNYACVVPSHDLARDATHLRAARASAMARAIRWRFLAVTYLPHCHMKMR